MGIQEEWLMPTCTKCNSSEFKVLRGVGNIRNLFEVQCLNVKCGERCLSRLGLGDVILEIGRAKRAKKTSGLSIDATPVV
jgi:hypothetical protein